MPRPTQACGTYGQLLPNLNTETVHRLPDMTGRPADLPQPARTEVRGLSQEV